MTETTSWKERLYARYISDGQARVPGENIEQLFASRASYIKHVIQNYVPTDYNIKILDLGCGHGGFLYFLNRAGYSNLAGVDISWEQVNLAHRLGIDCVEHGDIYQYVLTVNENTFDIILLMDVLEHYSRPMLFALLDEVYRVLRPGGKCIVHVPNAQGMYGMRVLFSDLTHELAFTSRSIHQLFSAIGFEQIKCHEDKPIIHNLYSLVRRIIWDLGTVPAKLLWIAETGESSVILSSNMTVTVAKPNV
ncbi:MAG: class I SAM-dependent methyltransferase [Caldilineaceae bacterium]